MHNSQLFVLIIAACHVLGAVAIPTLQAVGSKLFTSDGKQFFMKGIAYQLTEDDPLVDVEQCRRDATLMKQLGANAIRVYHVNATADHSGCMSIFANLGIYLFVDLDSFQTYIRYANVPSWNKNKSDAYRAVVDAFQQFDNTGGFFVGNEVLNVIEDSGSAPYVLAASVDTAAYRDARGYRKIPIGYSATDTGALPMLQDYFVCRANKTERLEFYALNSYRWCGSAATYNTSGYNVLQNSADGYPIPIFFSEVGCNTNPPREFNDQTAIFGPSMSGTWSGSIIYEWIEELNNYGLITYGPKLADTVQIGSSVIQGFTRQGTPTPVLPDFTNLQSRWATLNPTGISSSAYVTAISTRSRTCPAYTAGGWTVDPSAPLPTLGRAELSGITAVTTSNTAKSSATSGTSSGFGIHNKHNPIATTMPETGLLRTAAALAVLTGLAMVLL